MRIKNEEIDFASMDLAASITSNPISVEHIVNYAIQLVFTGSPVGTFKLQASLDEGRPSSSSESSRSFKITNWTDIANSSQAISAAGDIMYNVENAGYNWVRVVYTRSSGTGTLTVARANVKGV
jgi:hypothetical protein